MRVPLTGRRCALKTFYVFFKFGGKYHGSYAVIRERSYEKAKYAAYREWDNEVAGVYSNKEQAENKVQVYRLERI